MNRNFIFDSRLDLVPCLYNVVLCGCRSTRWCFRRAGGVSTAPSVRGVASHTMKVDSSCVTSVTSVTTSTVWTPHLKLSPRAPGSVNGQCLLSRTSVFLSCQSSRIDKQIYTSCENKESISFLIVHLKSC